MTTGERLFVRVDATLETGLGHFNRCVAIAQYWRETVGPVTFIGQFIGALPDELAEEGIELVMISGLQKLDVQATMALVPKGSPVILDGYQFDFAYQEQLAQSRRLLVIDDLGHLTSYAGSFLLNANVYAEEIDYANAPANRLLGLQYAPLRRDFRQACTTSRPCAGPIEQLLICFGGADAANNTLTVLQTLREIALPLARIRVVVGPLNPHADSLESFAALHEPVEILRSPPNMCSELLTADFVIAGAGTISAELACLGLPALLVAVVDNQLVTGPRMQQAGLAAYAGDLRELELEQLRSAIADALSDTKRQKLMRKRGPSLVDGQGAVRICKALSGAAHD